MKRQKPESDRTFIGPALLWKRIIAFLIDVLIIFVVVFYPFRKLLQSVLPKASSFSEMYNLVLSEAYDGYLVSAYVAMSLLAFLYFYLMERKMSQTIGRKIMKLYIISEKESLTRWQALVRNLVFIPIFPLNFLYIVDPAFMLFTKTNQTLTDILSKTKTVEFYNLDRGTAHTAD